MKNAKPTFDNPHQRYAVVWRIDNYPVGEERCHFTPVPLPRHMTPTGWRQAVRLDRKDAEAVLAHWGRKHDCGCFAFKIVKMEELCPK